MPILENEARDTKGKFLPGNRAAEKTGVTAFERHGSSVLAPEFRAEYDRFRAAVISDMGGESEISTLKMSYIERLAQMHIVLCLLTADISTRGLLTARGRTRRSVDQFFKAIDKFDRLATRLGLERRPKHVTHEEWLAQLCEEREDPEPSEEPES